MNTEWKCEAVEPQLTAYAMGELPADAVAAIRKHLDICASCQAAAQDIAATLEVVRAALAEAPQAAMHLDASRRDAAMRRPRRRWNAVLRDWLDLPADGPVEIGLWPGALAKAALIFLVPLTVALGLLVPGLRSAWHAATRSDEPVAESQPPPREKETPGFLVNLLPQPDAPLIEVAATNSSVADSALSPATGISNAAFDAAAEHWTGDSIVRNELPRGNKLGLGMNSEQQAADLAHAIAPLLAADLAKARAATQQTLAASQQPSLRRDKNDGKQHLTSTVATPPPATNYSLISPSPTNGQPKSATGK